MKTPHQQRVEKFLTEVFGKTIPDNPRLPDLKTRIARAKKLGEEFLEAVEALGFAPGFDITFYEIGEPDLVRIADACADISVVTTGILSLCGIKDVPLLEEVDRSNLTKVGGKVVDGMLVKPESYSPADVEGVINAQSCK